MNGIAYTTRCKYHNELLKSESELMAALKVACPAVWIRMHQSVFDTQVMSMDEGEFLVFKQLAAEYSVVDAYLIVNTPRPCCSDDH